MKFSACEYLELFCSYSLNLKGVLLLDDRYVHSLFAFGAVADFEFDCLTFVERLETIRYDTREVNEDFFAVLTRNESVAFLAIEPFYLTCHKFVN